ncbi:hypothetical protein K458DRAFT_127327 [Lentithecium fluviatile CBS 122367]|uniref:Uncharacterized protein n=1 Tax=Lentithecium fluviatile CBS 122367 TaxID=1168545 RepID=A0A6G1JGZ4_9PLEO|nr:hypothetical protein K458DRAFT_127327 [Lentithecium fluviatile CBS 122367]
MFRRSSELPRRVVLANTALKPSHVAKMHPQAPKHHHSHSSTIEKHQIECPKKKNEAAR